MPTPLPRVTVNDQQANTASMRRQQQEPVETTDAIANEQRSTDSGHVLATAHAQAVDRMRHQPQRHPQGMVGPQPAPYTKRSENQQEPQKSEISPS
jgi:hypothetical protein